MSSDDASMNLIANRLNLITPSPSLSAMTHAKKLIASGEDICNMVAGEPDFPTPDHIIEAAHAAMLAGHTRYTPADGTVALKEAIRRKFLIENGLAYELDEISVGAGAKQVLYNALTCSVNAGDEVIIPAPYWVSYPDIVRLNGGVPVFIEATVEMGFKITAQQLRQAITGSTKWLILNSPNNPSGAIYSEQELKALGAVLEEHPAIHILADDIYEHVIYDGARYVSFARANPSLAGRTVTVNGVSKAFAMTGWRIGYAGGPQTLVKAMEKLQSQTSGNPSSVSQAAAVAALNGPKDFFKDWLAQFTERRNLIVSMLDGKNGLRCAPPDGAFYAYISCPKQIGKTTPQGKHIGSDGDFVMYLLDEAKVATVQGAAYGISPAFRVSFATSIDTVREACRRILLACEALR